MRFTYSVLLIFILVIAAISCKKKESVAIANTETHGTAALQIKNDINDSVYLVLNGHDIATGVLPHIIKMTIAPQAMVVIPHDQLMNKYKYEYSWSTADYTYSNWWKTDSQNYPVEEVFSYYDTSASDYQLAINGPRRNDLLICLDGNGLSSSWKATNAFDANGTSVWSGLTEAKQNHEFIISRYHTIRHRFIDTASKMISTNLAFAIDLSGDSTRLQVTYDIEKYVLTNELAGIASLQTTAKDELFYAPGSIDSAGNVSYKEPYYLLKRVSVER